MENGKLETQALLNLNANVGELTGKVDRLLDESREHSAELRVLLNRLHATELTLSNKRRPIVLGLSGGTLAAVVIAIAERFFV